MRPQKPWNDGRQVFRHVVTVHVDTYERSAEKVMAEVQNCLDENTHVIQPEGVVEFENAKAVTARRQEVTEQNQCHFCKGTGIAETWKSVGVAVPVFCGSCSGTGKLATELPGTPTEGE